MTAIQDSPSFFRLRALLEAGNWRAEDQMIARALPHFIDEIDALETVRALENLGVDVKGHRCNSRELAADDCPALFQPQSGPMVGLLDKADGKFLVHRSDSHFPGWEKFDPVDGLLIRVGQNRHDDDQVTLDQTREVTNLRSHIGSYGPLLLVVFFTALLTNILAFAPAGFILVVYDRVIPTGSQSLLIALAMGMCLVLGTDILLRYLRNKAIAFVGADVDKFMGKMLFRKLMSMPLEQLTKTGVDQQFNRLKQFESIRDAFTGPVLISLFDLPFTLIFALVIFYISPTLGYCIVGTALAFLIAYLTFAPLHGRAQTKSAKSKLVLQNLQSEIISSQKAIRRLGVQQIWLDRIELRAQDAASDMRNAKQISLSMQAVGQSLMMLAGAMTILIGASGVINGTLTQGGLVASMALVWRVLSPLQAIYGAVPQIKGHWRSFSQIERIASLPEESRSGLGQTQAKAFKGKVELISAAFRYLPTGDPVISNVSLCAEPGRMVAISGLNGAGKSTILKLLSNLHAPMSGSLRVDGMDTRQIPVDDLRTAISFAPQEPEFFFGTIAQNFRLNNILATDEEIWDAIRAVGLEEKVLAFPKGINTQMNDDFLATMSRSVLKALSISRALVKDAPIYIFDEPSNGLDRDHDAAIVAKLNEMKAKRTIIICTRFSHHLLAADHAIFLVDGRISMEGKGSEVLAQLQGHPLGKTLL